MFGIDTCSWLKLDLLANSGWDSTVTMLFNELELFTTHEVVEELNRFLSHRKGWLKRITIRTHDQKTFSHFAGDVFDPADASLLSLTQVKDVIIITEDPVMLAENVFLRENVIQLIDLFSLLFQENRISQQDFNRLLSFFRKKRNITKRNASLLKK